MAEDRPLSSKEMIERARQEISLPQSVQYGTPGPVAPEEELAPVDAPGEREPTRQPRRPGISRRRRVAARQLPPDPFTQSRRPANPQARARALAVATAFATLLFGIGIALALFASSTP